MKNHTKYKSISFLAIIFIAIFVTGCSTRSISNTNPNSRNSFYKGELTDQDVIGAVRMTSKNISEAEIKNALNKSRNSFKLPRNSSVLLIQSGAITPDPEMQNALKQYYSIAPYSGIPPSRNNKNEIPTEYSKVLRLTAANGGHDKILVYWGELKSGQINQVTKTVSWIPFVGGILPDEVQQMQIVLRFALVDVISGRWATLTPQVFENKIVSGRYNRKSNDAKQIIGLKAQAYDAAAKEIFEKFNH